MAFIHLNAYPKPSSFTALKIIASPTGMLKLSLKGNNSIIAPQTEAIIIINIFSGKKAYKTIKLETMKAMLPSRVLSFVILIFPSFKPIIVEKASPTINGIKEKTIKCFLRNKKSKTANKKNPKKNIIAPKPGKCFSCGLSTFFIIESSKLCFLVFKKNKTRIELMRSIKENKRNSTSFNFTAMKSKIKPKNKCIACLLISCIESTSRKTIFFFLVFRLTY